MLKIFCRKDVLFMAANYYNYKYNPNDYSHILTLKSDLLNFYKLYERCKKSSSESDEFALEKHAQDMLFTIKHRELEGFITRIFAEYMREYMRELLEDCI